MGGTSFDVGLVVERQPRLSNTVLYERFRVHVPVVEVMSIGAGGGSIAWIDPLTRTLHVGPNSAGSLPGPVCYERGGTEPTVTDADIVLNRISAESFFGGRQRLNRDMAFRAIEQKIASSLGYDPIRAAKGIVDIVDARMADLIRKLTVERGLDPRDFVLFSYGGAGPVHVGAYGREIGVRFAVVSPYAPVFSALGIASSDIVRHYTKSEPMHAPFDGERMEQAFQGLEEKAVMDLRKSGVQDGYSLHRSVNMRFRFQVHEIQVPVSSPLSGPAEVDRLIARFLDLYEQTFGRGTGLREAGVEVLTFHVISVVTTQQALIKKFSPGSPDPGSALRGSRSVFWEDSFLDTPVFDRPHLAPGNRISGPAIIEAPNTTILVHPGHRSWVDDYANIVIELEG
jgi:N-methylhydantoinase A